MTYFTTEMVFIHPPRRVAGHYTGARRPRFGCRSRIAAPACADERARDAAGADEAVDTAAAAEAAATPSADIGLAA